MTAVPFDIAAAIRKAAIVRHEDDSIKAAFPGARDGSLTADEGFFDHIADAQAIVSERSLALAGERRFSAEINDQLWLDASLATPNVRLVDDEQSLDQLLCCSRIEVDLEAEVTRLELFRGPGDEIAPTPPPAARFITPAGSGIGDGSSWEDAAPITSINAMIAQAAVDGVQVWLRADQGSYTLPSAMVINSGGSPGSPVVVRGVDSTGSAMPAVLVGDRAPAWTAGQAVGSEHLWLNAGASNLTFQSLAFRDAGTCFRLREANSNLAFEDIEGANIRRLIANYASSGFTAPVSGLTIRRCEARGFSKQMIQLKHDTSAVLIEDCFGDAEHQGGDAWPTGIALDGTVHDVIIRRCHMTNCGENRGSAGYWNGDSFVGERDVYNILIEDCLAENSYDGGFDFKSQIILVRCTAIRCKRNFRLWGNARMIQCIGRDPTYYGGTGSTGNVYAYQNSRLLVESCTFSQISNSAVFTTFQAGFMAVDQATISQVTKPSAAAMSSSEGDPDGLWTIWDHADVTPPAVASMALRRVLETDPLPAPITAPYNFQFAENSARVIDVQLAEPGTLEISGPDAALVARYGRSINISRQDFEQPGTADGSQTLKRVVRVLDANGNYSPAYSLQVQVLDAADAPIDAAEVFAPPGSSGTWLVVKPERMWADIAMTVPALLGDGVAVLADVSGSGNHLRFEDADRRPIWRKEDGFDFLQFDGARTVGQLGAVGGFRYPQFTTVAMIERARDATDGNQAVVFFGRRALSTDGGANSSNQVYMLACRDTSSLRYQTTSTTGNSPGTGGTRERPLVISHRSTDGIVRSNGVVVIDGTNVTANSYPLTDEQPIVGARYDGTGYVGLFKGRLYALFIVNRAADDDTRFRIERQFAETAGLAL